MAAFDIFLLQDARGLIGVRKPAAEAEEAGKASPAFGEVGSCRTAAAVLGAQARRRLTAPGLPGAQGP